MNAAKRTIFPCYEFSRVPAVVVESQRAGCVVSAAVRVADSITVWPQVLWTTLGNFLAS